MKIQRCEKCGKRWNKGKFLFNKYYLETGIYGWKCKRCGHVWAKEHHIDWFLHDGTIEWYVDVGITDKILDAINKRF